MLERMVIDGVDVPEDGSDRTDHVGELLERIAGGDQSAFTAL